MTGPSPIASIVICTYNRSDLLRLCIDSIADMPVPSEQYEVIVVDNNSKDETAQVCSGIPQKYPGMHFRYILEQKQGVGFTRTRGAMEAAGAIIAYIDDDCLADRNWLASIIEFYQNNPQAYSTGGCIIPKYLTPVADWFGKYFWGLVGHYDLGKKIFQMQGARYPAGANMHFRKQAFEEFGYFDGQLGRSGTSLMAGEEKAMYLKLLNGGKKVYYLPNVIVQHHVLGNKFDKAYVRKHSMGIGASERIMNAGSAFKLVKKCIEYIAKLGYAIAYGFLYLFSGKPQKMVMLIKFRWWVLEGFFYPEKTRS